MEAHVGEYPIKERLMSFAFKTTPRISLSYMLIRPSLENKEYGILEIVKERRGNPSAQLGNFKSVLTSSSSSLSSTSFLFLFKTYILQFIILRNVIAQTDLHFWCLN